MQGFYYLRGAVSPRGVVAEQLLVGVRGEAVDCARAPQLVEVLGISWRQLLVRGVRDEGQVVYSHVRCTSDISCPDLDVVGVEQEEQFSELAYPRGELGGEVGEDADDGLVVFVKQKTSSFELGEERLDSASHCL